MHALLHMEAPAVVLIISFASSIRLVIMPLSKDLPMLSSSIVSSPRTHLQLAVALHSQALQVCKTTPLWYHPGRQAA